MGGKGGDGGGGNWQDTYATDPNTGGVMTDASGALVTKAQYAAQQAAQQAAAAPAPAAPAPAAPAPAAPAPAGPAPADPSDASPSNTGPIGPSIGAGSGVVQPSSGDNPGPATTGGSLASSVIKPPQYWVGNRYNKPNNKSSAVTTQT